MQPSEELPVVPSQVEVLLGLSRVEGQLGAFIQLMTAQGDAITKLNGDFGQMRDKHNTDIGLLRERVTAIEASQTATRSATPPWWVVLGAFVPLLGFLWLVAERMFGK